MANVSTVTVGDLGQVVFVFESLHKFHLMISLFAVRETGV